MVIGRVEALADGGRQHVDRLDDAITLVRLAQPVVGAAGRHSLTVKLADLLVDRGVWYGSACRNVGIEPDMTRAVDDLRQALGLRPDSSRARDNLARALMYGRDGAAPDPPEAVKLAALVEAFAVLIPQLSSSSPPPTRDQIAEMIGSPASDVLVARVDGEILGAHMAGARATDLISELVAVHDLEGGFAEVARIVHPHPTFSEATLEAARSTDGWLIHG